MPPSAAGAGATVFVMDDDLSVGEALESLIRLAGWKVETLSSAQAFLDRRDDGTPGCLVLDVGLPDLSGLGVQERLARLNRDLPILSSPDRATFPPRCRPRSTTPGNSTGPEVAN